MPGGYYPVYKGCARLLRPVLKIKAPRARGFLTLLSRMLELECASEPGVQGVA